ncbi:hypothetical protein L249_5972 [Ophiocordyceps polyrhachis-furcata BCC 54312]|uniref:Oligopeptide transporter n=1 Tax=Ophiocordyceps polyrhachis-furcata BCC 54312 TaxID=1330021 RepID=A0A367LJ75_9HYPO|nr:hypothetical protein L249_5972 [Ophiocordyceps polyrhachis-furcata BCC 54312]
MDSTTNTASVQSPRHFTVRSVSAGLTVGAVICAANIYFGLQTGWVSIMSMPASLMGFGIFQLLRPHLRFPFTPVENVLLQSVACGVGIMPLGCGFVGVIPAMNYLLAPEERGPLSLRLEQLIVWSLGLCYFGVVFAVPLRHQVIVRERLKFPSGFSTAVLISVLHGHWRPTADREILDAAAGGSFASLVPQFDCHQPSMEAPPNSGEHGEEGLNLEQAEQESELSVQLPPELSDWALNMRLLLTSFCVSGALTTCTYFFPTLRNIPFLGTGVANSWLWTLNPSLAYVGQGIIMGIETTTHMTVGAIVGWGFLSPLAKYQGWAPGPVDDWQHGSKGWIVWVSLAIMLADAVVSLCYLSLRTFVGIEFAGFLERETLRLHGLWNSFRRRAVYARLPSDELGQHQGSNPPARSLTAQDENEDTTSHTRNPTGHGQRPTDAPAVQLIGVHLVAAGLIVSILLCIGTVHIVFGNLVPVYTTVVAVFMALVLSIMGVRALGETDLNPVSGISKLAQLFFALIVPQSSKSSVLINLVAGAIGALQAGDLMQDLKTGHLLGASPQAQFWGQMIGATAGAFLSAVLYRLYTNVYQIPGELFQVPTAYVWIFTARLVTGQGLPPMASKWASGAGALFTLTTMARIASVGKFWRAYVPGGIAVAIGMYNVPSFTLGRAIGGLIGWYWTKIKQRSSTSMIIMASGFILGEGFLSILNLILQSSGVPHF